MRWPGTDAADRAVIFALFYLAASRLAASLGQYGDATHAARRGAVHANHDTPLARRYRVPLLLADARAAVQSGDLTRGAGVIEQIRPLSDADRDPGLSFEMLELSAKLDLLRGKFGDALDSLQRAAALAARWPAAVQAACLENLAALQILVNQTAKARHTLDQAESRRLPSGAGASYRLARLRVMADLRARAYDQDMPLSISSLWNGDGDAPEASGETAGPTVTAGEDDNKQPVDFLEWFEQRTLAVQLALGQGRGYAASMLLQAVEQTFAATDSDVIDLRIGYYKALLAYYQSDYTTADTGVSALIPRLEELGLLHDEWQARRLQTWILRRTGAPQATIDASVAQEERTLTALAASLDPVSRAIFLLNKWTADEEAIAILAHRAMDAQHRAAAAAAPLRWWYTLQSWRRALAVEHRLEASKRAVTEIAAGAAANAAAPPRLIDLWWRQPRDEARLTFSVLPDRVVAIVRSRGLVRVRVLDVSRIALRESVRRWHERLLEPRGGQASPADPLSAKLASLAAELPAAVRHLRIRPDDALHGYPFAALPLDGAFCAERFTITLGDTAAIADAPEGAREGVVISVAQAIGEFPALPHASAEVTAVTALLSRFGYAVRALTGRDVRARAAAAALAQAAVVHIACHGQFQPDQPSRTGLVFADDEGQASVLSLTDIARIDAKGLQHVTLSACWSADNYVVPGRWILSLPEMFCRAGARSVSPVCGKPMTGWPPPSCVASMATWRTSRVPRRYARRS